MPPNRNCWSVKLATMCENRCEFTKHEWTPRTVCSVKYSVPKTSVRVRKWLRDTESKMGEGVWKLKENGDWAWRIKSLGNGWLLGNVNILLQSCAIGHGYALLCMFYHMKVWIHGDIVIPNNLIFFYIALVNWGLEKIFMNIYLRFIQESNKFSW